ncbi:MAG TPA: hypothetical protein VFC54_14590 [Pseudolabrys sp.]|nr:hypothetical protein [Pseudolabrys sp.]
MSKTISFIRRAVEGGVFDFPPSLLAYLPRTADQPTVPQYPPGDCALRDLANHSTRSVAGLPVFAPDENPQDKLSPKAKL